MMPHLATVAAPVRLGVTRRMICVRQSFVENICKVWTSISAALQRVF